MSSGSRGRAGVFAAMLAAAAMLMAGVGLQSAGATHQVVTAVKGSAFGYHADNITLFGGAQPDVGPTPTVTLAANAGNSPQSATAASGVIAYGPAVLFTSDQIQVTTAGTLGPTGSVTSTATIQNVNKSTTQPVLTGSEILTADTIASTCTASESGTTGSTTITNGTLETDNGLDLNGDGDYTDPGEHAPVVVSLPSSPSPGHTVTGHIHLGATTDTFRVVFNEQIPNAADGSLTVNAVHEYFGEQGGNLRGDLILGQVVCGVTTIAAPTTTSSSTSTTLAPTTTSSSTSTTLAPTTTSSSTSTTLAPTTTSSSTSTTLAPTTTSSSTSTTLAPTTTSSSTSTTLAPTTTSSSTSTTLAPTTTSSSTSTTLGSTTTSSSTSTTVSQTTTTVGPDCLPGNGRGDPNHCHTGPPGQTGDFPGNADPPGFDGRPAGSTRNVPPPFVLAGLGVLFLISLIVPFRRSRRGEHRAGR